MSATPHLSRPRAALFLDRDGVINVDRGYVARRADFTWREGIFRLARVARERDVPIVVVTNQSGIGRGLYTAAEFAELNDWMCAEFARRDVPLAAVYHCPHHPDALIPELRAAHPWRKPAPGMILAARDDLALDLGRSVLVGDQWSDMVAADAAGIGTAVLVGEPRGPVPEPRPAVVRLADVEAVADWYAARLALAGD